MKRTLITLAGLLLPITLHAQFSQPMRDVENPAQNAFMARGTLSLASAINVNVIGNIQAPPAGKRLTIESLGLRCVAAPTVTTVSATVTFWIRNSPSEGLINANFPIEMVRQGPAIDSVIWVGTFNGRAFHDGPATASINVARFPMSSSEMSCSYALMGGLTNLPLQ